MFETSFSHSSATPIPPNLSIENGVSLMHDFETMIKLSPDTRGCKPAQPTNGYARTNGTKDTDRMQFWEVEDDLPFIPKKLWAGGVKYKAEFMPLADGCDIIVHAPGGFNSTNHWRLIRDAMPEGVNGGLERIPSKDMLHADTHGSGWYVQIFADACCSRTYAGFVKGFLKNTISQLQHRFIETLKSVQQQQQQKQGQNQQPRPPRRPTMGRRNSSVL